MCDDRDEGLRALGILICVLAICGAAAGIVTAILWWVASCATTPV